LSVRQKQHISYWLDGSWDGAQLAYFRFDLADNKTVCDHLPTLEADIGARAANRS